MKELKDSVYRVDNLSDPEADKVLRVNTRFDRVERFIAYLRDEEDTDFKVFGLDTLESSLSCKFMPDIEEAFGKQREWIGRRIAENRERFIEETFIRLSDADTETL